MQGVCASMTVAGVGSLAPFCPRTRTAGATPHENPRNVGQAGDDCLQTDRWNRGKRKDSQVPDYCMPDAVFIHRYACELARKEERWLSERSQLQADVKSVTREQDQALKVCDSLRANVDRITRERDQALEVRK